MSRSYTKGYHKLSSSNKSYKKISNKKFRLKSKRDPENIIDSKKQGLNSYAFHDKPTYMVDCDWVTYRYFCK